MGLSTVANGGNEGSKTAGGAFSMRSWRGRGNAAASVYGGEVFARRVGSKAV